MFGLGLGEIILIFLIIFLICPKDIPKALRKLGEIFATIEKLKENVFDINKDIQDIITDDDKTGFDIEKNVLNKKKKK